MSKSRLKNTLLGPLAAQARFAEWASLFSGEIFVQAVAYIDESGTHDETGRQPNSSVAVVAGLVDTRDSWVEFCKDWQAALNKHGAPYFHFHEFYAASRVARGGSPPKNFHKNPYKTWSLSRLDPFLYELAEIVGAGNKVIVGGWIETLNMNKAKSKGGVAAWWIKMHGTPYQIMLKGFFKQLPNDIVSGWPDWDGGVAIFFDQCDKLEWKQSVLAAHHFAKERDCRIGEIAFADKKIAPHLPLQAADMVAYRFRQLDENFHGGKLAYNPLPQLDRLMLKSMFNQVRNHGTGPIESLM